MIVLVDMDGVITNLEQRVLDRFRECHPDRPYVPLDQRVHFHPADDYLPEDQPRVTAIIRSPGFYGSLEPLPGGREALQEMSKMHDVRICTAPLSVYRHCVLEKYQWVEEQLGPAWVKKIIMTKDKTFVKGSYLLDDKPTVDGACRPEWIHLLFDQPYNRAQTDKPRITWENWKDFLWG